MNGSPSPDEERLRAVFRALGDQRVEYAVFGAAALGLHGLARATADLDLFIKANQENVERLKRALRSVFSDPTIDEISAEDLCGGYPAVRYLPSDGFGFDVLTRLGTAFRYEDLEIEERDFEGVPVRLVTPRRLWMMKKDTAHPSDRIDAQVLAERFGFREK